MSAAIDSGRYVAAKHAVERITKSVALELAKPGIRVNAVAPGATDTGMPTRFTATAENKAALVTRVPLGHLGRRVRSFPEPGRGVSRSCGRRRGWRGEA